MNRGLVMTGTGRRCPHDPASAKSLSYLVGPTGFEPATS